MITCCHCGITKESCNFYKDKSKKTGFKPRCKPCDKLSVDMKSRLEYEKIYWDINREKKRSIVLKSFNSNKEHHKKIRREYLDSIIGKTKHREYSSERRSRVINAFVEKVDIEEKFKSQNGECYICKEIFPKDSLELDHVIPLAKGGLHSKQNTKLACRSCNRSKGAKLQMEAAYQMV